jgi:hypothetical protein
MTKSQTVAALGNQLDSFYSLEQVIKIVESIEEEQVKPKLSVTQLREITDSIMDLIEDEANRDNIVDMGDIEFEIGYDKRIEVTDVPINFDVIRDCVEKSLSEAFDEEEDIVELERANTDNE